MSMRDTLRKLADYALDTAEDGRPHEDAPGEYRLSMVALMPLLRALRQGDSNQALDAAKLLQQDMAACSAGSDRFLICDGLGQVRPVYVALFLHVLDRCGVEVSEQETPSYLRQWDEPLTCDLWHCVRDNSVALPQLDAANGLHTQGLDLTTDVWVWRELTGLHALDWLAQSRNDSALQARVHEACKAHVALTQPDYTTYQPWALAAFMRNEDTHSFVGQQLHDVSSHMALMGPSGAVVPGVLLALADLDTP